MVPHLGVKPSKQLFWGVNRRFQAKLANSKKRAYYQNHCIECKQIWHSDKDHQMPSVGGPNTRITNPRWRTPPSWKNRKIAISRSRLSDFDEIWHNAAVRPFWPLKISNFEKQTWRRPLSIFKNPKIAISRQRLDRSSRNLAQWRNSTPMTCPTVKNSQFQKSRTTAAAI